MSGEGNAVIGANRSRKIEATVIVSSCPPCTLKSDRSSVSGNTACYGLNPIVIIACSTQATRPLDRNISRCSLNRSYIQNTIIIFCTSSPSSSQIDTARSRRSDRSSCVNPSVSTSCGRSTTSTSDRYIPIAGSNVSRSCINPIIVVNTSASSPSDSDICRTCSCSRRCDRSL